jgi:pimeloyl-[acyl-carrier protein] methyl ester esterase
MPVCKLKDGAEIAYADQGVGVPILLVHGWAAHPGFFDALADRLAQSHRVLTPALRGHVGSTGGAAPLTIDTLADDICQFCDALQLNRIYALGWSMGAMALWAAAPRLGARLEGLIVEDMGPRLTHDETWPHGLAGGYSADDIGETIAEIQSDWPSYVARFAPRMFAPRAKDENPALIAWAVEEMSRCDPASMASLWASMAAQDFRTRLQQITQPMLVIHGGESQVYPIAATTFVANVAQKGAHVVVPSAGHVPHLEAPEVFFNHIEAFVRTARRSELKSGGAVP